MQRVDENTAPQNGKKNIVTKLCANFELKSIDATPVGKRDVKTPKNNLGEKSILRVDAERKSIDELSTPTTPGPMSPSRLPFKRILPDESLVFTKDTKVPQSSKKAKLKSLGGKSGGDQAVRTCIRFKPFGFDEQDGDRSAYAEDNSVVLKYDKKETVRYSFDEVCAEHITQDEMFDRAARKLTDDFLEGYNATIFAYGQTGSGKTHTMLGDLNLHSANRGITPRVFVHVFKELARQGSFELKVSFLQIYNEKCQDLLNPAVSNKIGHVEEDLKIRENADGVFVEGLSKIVCKSAEQALECVAKGIRNRKTGKTAMNTESSRSHSILIVDLTTESYTSSLRLIDLAGSENQKTSTASSAMQQNEANNINLSLTYLGQCLREAVKGGAANHVNYRNSKLTKLLKDSLGGNAKTCVIATVSAHPAFATETASTLKFAATIKSVQTHAVKNSVRGSPSSSEAEVMRLKQELREAQTRLATQAAEYQVKLKQSSAVAEGGSDSASQLVIDELNDKVRNLEIEIAELIQTRYQEKEDFETLLRAKEEELATTSRGGDKYTAEMREMKNAYDSLQRQMTNKPSANTLEFDHVNQALQTSQRVIEELQLSLQTAQAEKAKLQEDLDGVHLDMNFLLEQKFPSATAEELEQILVDARSKTGVKLPFTEEVSDPTIRRLAGRSTAATNEETVAALQNEVLLLQENSQKDLSRIDELRTLVHQLQETVREHEETKTRDAAKIEELKAEVSRLQIQKNTPSANTDAGEMQQLKADLEAKTAEIEAKNNEISKQRDKCRQHSMELNSFRAARKNTMNLESEHKTCKSTLNKLHGENQDLQRQLQSLQQQLSQERNDQDELCRLARNTEGEKHRALLDKLEADFGGKLPLGNQARLFIREGVLKRVSTHNKLLEYHFFLFTDVLIYASPTKPHTGGKFKAHRVIHLGLCRLIDIQPRPDSEANTLYCNSFRLVTPQKSDAKEHGFCISCDTPAEKQIWMTAIRAQIEKVYSQPEGSCVQVPRAADVSIPEIFDTGRSTEASSTRSSFSVCDEERKDVRSRESSMDFNDELQNDVLEVSGGLAWAPDDPNRPRAPSNDSIVSRSRANSVSSVFSRMTEFTAAELPTSQHAALRGKLQARDFCRLCVRSFGLTRPKAQCGCCRDNNICKKCCSHTAIPPRSDGKEKKVCLACYGGITKLVGRGIPRLSVEYE